MFSPRATTRVQLPGLDGEGKPAFLVRTPSMEERMLFEADLASPPYNAGPVPAILLIAALRDAVTEWTPEGSDDRGAFMAALAQAEAAPEEMGTEDAQRLKGLEDTAKAAWPPFQALLAQRQRRHRMLPFLAVRRFLAGWEGLDTEFATGPDGRVSEACLSALGDDAVHLLGMRIFAMLTPSADEGKSSGPPPASTRGPRTSTGASARQTAGRAGKLGRTSGRKTRA